MTTEVPPKYYIMKHIEDDPLILYIANKFESSLHLEKGEFCSRDNEYNVVVKTDVGEQKRAVMLYTDKIEFVEKDSKLSSNVPECLLHELRKKTGCPTTVKKLFCKPKFKSSQTVLITRDPWFLQVFHGLICSRNFKRVINFEKIYSFGIHIGDSFLEKYILYENIKRIKPEHYFTSNNDEDSIMSFLIQSLVSLTLCHKIRINFMDYFDSLTVVDTSMYDTMKDVDFFHYHIQNRSIWLPNSNFIVKVSDFSHTARFKNVITARQSFFEKKGCFSTCRDIFYLLRRTVDTAPSSKQVIDKLSNYAFGCGIYKVSRSHFVDNFSSPLKMLYSDIFQEFRKTPTAKKIMTIGHV